ncbi:MAG: YidC/Oxa1 family insertase periplasmic-domain containing protein [Phycisphaerae bacterium]
MQSDGRRTLLATVLCVVVMVGWVQLYKYLYPPKEIAAVTTTTAPVGPEERLAATSAPAGAGELGPDYVPVPTASRPGEPPAESNGLRFVGGDAPQTVVIGDDRQPGEVADPSHPDAGVAENPFEFRFVVTNVGAGVESVTLSHHRAHVARNRKHPDHDPYELVRPVTDEDANDRYVSFTMERIRVDDRELSLRGAVWSLSQTSDRGGKSATLEATIRDEDRDLLRLRKTFHVPAGSREAAIAIEVENLSDKPHRVMLTEAGPIGVSQADLRYDYRRAVTGVLGADGQIILGEKPTRKEVFAAKEDEAPHVKVLRCDDDQHPVWAAVGNKYFAVILAPEPHGRDARYPAFLRKLTALTRLDATGKDDLTFEYVLDNGAPLAPAGSATYDIRAYCGPKNREVLEAFGSDRDYYVVTNADRRSCNIEFISTAMLWLLTNVEKLVGNYGIAIIILVIIVKLILHPVSKRGQIHMMRMQKGMAQLKPKLDVIQKQFKNDKQQLQKETMKLYREEGINPAGQFLGCLPMALQMPIWIALWSTLNTNVDMRHQPFFFWIRDLSAPDALMTFQHGFKIPLIGAFMGGPIVALNLLPIIMAITMYAQQKLTKKLTQPDQPVKPVVDADGKPVVDQQAQMQKMMGFMMVFMGLIFYNFPSGLNLYILTSNLLGILEQWQIRKHIREKEASGELLKPKKKTGFDAGPSRPSFIERLQKKAEQARQASVQNPERTRKKKGKRQKQPRF